jgi:UDP-glucose 4-epimerase
MRVLVTGATGFVGRLLVPALAQRGWTVRAAMRDNQGARFPSAIEIARHGDLSGQIDWSPLVEGCSTIVHLAGIAHSEGVPPEQHDRVNRRATEKLVDAATRAGAGRFILVSSIRAQSGPSADHTLRETDEARPTDIYGRSKLAAETAVRASNVDYVILRPVVIYGPGVKGNLAALARLAASPLPLPFGAMRNRRSLLDVRSLIDAIDLALQMPAMTRETFIVADRDPISFRDLVAALRRGLKRPPRLVSVPLPVLRAALRALGRRRDLERLDGELIADPTKLIATGWQPTIDTAAALAQWACEMAP